MAHEGWRLDASVVNRPEDLHVGTDGFNDGGPDEDRRKCCTLEEATAGDVAFEGRQLPPVAIASHDDVESLELHLIGASIEDRASEEDEAGTGPKRRKAASDGVGEGIGQATGVEQQADRRRLSPGQDDPSNALKVCLRLDLEDLTTESLEASTVLADVALEGEHPNGCTHRYQPRSA